MIWIKSCIAIANYERFFSSSFTMSCHTGKPQVFSVKIIIFCRTTHLLQDVNNITHKEVPWRLVNKHFIFNRIFINLWKNIKQLNASHLELHVFQLTYFFTFSFYINQPSKPSKCLIMTSCWVRMNSAISKIYYGTRV